MKIKETNQYKNTIKIIALFLFRNMFKSSKDYLYAVSFHADSGSKFSRSRTRIGFNLFIAGSDNMLM